MLATISSPVYLLCVVPPAHLAHHLYYHPMKPAHAPDRYLVSYWIANMTRLEDPYTARTERERLQNVGELDSRDAHT